MLIVQQTQPMGLPAGTGTPFADTALMALLKPQGEDQTEAGKVAHYEVRLSHWLRLNAGICRPCYGMLWRRKKAVRFRFEIGLLQLG